MSVLLPYQQRWYADKSPLRVCEKSRRVGITWAEAARQVMRAARAKHAGGSDCYYVSTSHRLGRVYIEECAEWARALNTAATHFGTHIVQNFGKDVLTHEIRFASGFSVQAITSNPSSMRGLGGSAPRLPYDPLLRRVRQPPSPARARHPQARRTAATAAARAGLRPPRRLARFLAQLLAAATTHRVGKAPRPHLRHRHHPLPKCGGRMRVLEVVADATPSPESSMAPALPSYQPPPPKLHHDPGAAWRG
jgi:hypothetical protein